ncbi:hypothetical protein EBR21_13600 [bacterium]|nr:hypothetical protein [bacterium]
MAKRDSCLGQISRNENSTPGEPCGIGGDGLTVNATTDHHGPSWRMVVTWVDAQPKAWGIYPGGPSGHVGSPYYSNMIDTWLKGKLDELLFVQQGLLKDSLTMSRTKLEATP